MGDKSKILATTGFQNRQYVDKAELYNLLRSVLKTESKMIEYIQTSLRTAGEIYKKGGNVTMKYRDQIFRMHFDNRRVLTGETTIPSGIEQMLDSQPLKNVKLGENLRFIGSLSKKRLYGKYTSGPSKAKYVSDSEISVRNFIKGMVSSPPLFNLPPNSYTSRSQLQEFLKGYNPLVNISVESISRYKSRLVTLSRVKRTKESMNFVSYVKTVYPTFDEDLFFQTVKKE